jgi:hypothetical protein
MQIIITDLTRFKNLEFVCTAGVADDGPVVRPMPYLTSDDCRRLDIHPGGIVESHFTYRTAPAPHIEDAGYKKLEFKGPCSKAEFKKALEKTLYANIAAGFGAPIRPGEKCIPIASRPVRSLITIQVDPRRFTIYQDSYHPDRLQARFVDRAGAELAFVAVTDRGFYDYAQQHREDARAFLQIKRFIQSQQELYLRLGLSRAYKAPDGREGYWIQLNGIYTFPDKLAYIRCYG